MVTPQVVLERMRQGTLQRILAFGSSNTEHFLSGMHWFDCLDLALKQTISFPDRGRMHRCINTGIGGNTTADLLARFDEDAAFYKPHWVFITIGGNDANPARNLSADLFRANLLELHKRFSAMGTAVTYQTYYAPNPATCGQAFYDYMQILRDVATETQSDLVDHLARWEPFRVKHRADYVGLMQDGFHVNYRGNMVMGLDLARRYGLLLGNDRPSLWERPLACQALMDAAGND